MSDKKKYVVLKVIDGEPGWMDTYAPQVAMVCDYESMEQAAMFNVGNHPEAKKTQKPEKPAYRAIVIPWEHWHEFEIYTETHLGRDDFAAYASRKDNLTIHPNKE